MNAITVNYAEVGDDHLPKSFGLVRNSDLDNQTVYNSNITKITGTNYSILQSRDIGTKDIIVSSDPKSSRLLSTFTPGATGWIQHRIPGSDKTAYIFYKNDGNYYKIVEDENGRPVQAKYAPYAYLTNVKDNAGIQPYCEATIETPVPLQVSAGSVKAVINSEPVDIARTDYSLVVKLENVDGPSSSPTIGDQYSIDTSIYDLNSINWTRDGQKVTSWLLDDNKIVKSFISISSDGRTKTIKLLAGNNVVTILRNKSTITVTFTFTNTAMSSFEWGGAYYNGLENSTMSGNTLTIKNVKQGSSVNLATFYTDSEASWFSPSSISPLPGQSTFNVKVSIPTPSVTDTIKFTGWIDGKLEQGYSIEKPHGILPQAYTIDKMNTEVSAVDITNETTAISGLLTYDLTSKQFKRHRQITQINKSSTSTRTTTIDDDNKNPGTTSTDIYLYASNNNVSQTFNVTAHYTNIPAVVSVTKPSSTAVASNNQVVLFEGTYYVADTNMKSLVESLVSGVTVTAQKEIVGHVAWETTILQIYYKMSTTKDGNVTYTPEFAEITISGISSQVISVKSSDSNLTAQLTNQALSGTDISITIHYTVPDGYSLLNTGHQPSLDVPSIIPATDWNKTATYKFFN